jgi:DNA-binding response OmpR family regulator
VHQKGHIVVVKPDELIRQLLETWLSEAGYRIVWGTGDLAVVDDLRCVTTFRF